MFADTTTIIHHCKHFLLTNGESGKRAAFSVLRRNLLPARYSGRVSTRFNAKDQSIGAPSVRKKRGLKPRFFAFSLSDRRAVSARRLYRLPRPRLPRGSGSPPLFFPFRLPRGLGAPQTRSCRDPPAPRGGFDMRRFLKNCRGSAPLTR